MADNIAGRYGDPTDWRTAIQQIKSLREQLKKAQQGRTDAESRAVAVETESSYAVCPSLLEPNLADDIDTLLNQLDTDYSTVSHTIDSHQQDIPQQLRLNLAQLLQITAKQHIKQARAKVHAIKHSIRESNNQAKTDPLSTARAAILSVTQHLQAFNRQIRIHVNTERGNAPANHAFEFERGKLPDGLNLDELLDEFKIAAEKPIHAAEVTNSLREQVRVATAAQWKAEKDAYKAKKETSEALLRLSLTQTDSGDAQKLRIDFQTMALQLDKCHRQGEERRLEIERLRKLLKEAGKAPKPLLRAPTPNDSDDSSTRQEVRALFEILKGYMQHSEQYQQIITKLEGEALNGLKNYIQHSEKYQQIVRNLEGEVLDAKRADTAEYGEHTKSLRNQFEIELADERNQCEEAKRLLQDQIDSLKIQDSEYQELNADRKRLYDENDALRVVTGDDVGSEVQQRWKDHEKNLEMQIQRIGRDNRLLQKALCQAKADLSVAETRLAESLEKDMGKEGDGLTKWVVGLREKVNHERDKSNTAEIDMHDLRGKFRALKKDLADTKKKLEHCLAHKSDKHAIEALTNERDTAKKALADALAKFKLQTDEFEQTTNELLSKIENLEKVRNDMKQQRRSDAADLAQAEKELEECLAGNPNERAIVELRDERDAAVQALAHADKVHMEQKEIFEEWITDLRDARENLVSRTDELTEQLDAAEADLSTTQQALRDCLKRKDPGGDDVEGGGYEEGGDYAEEGGDYTEGEEEEDDDGTDVESDGRENPGENSPVQSPTPALPLVVSTTPSGTPGASATEDDPVSEDTPPLTPHGTKRKARPGARLRRETRANKRRAQGWYPQMTYDVHEPSSPPGPPL